MADAGCSSCPRSFDQAQVVMVAQWYDPRPTTRGTRFEPCLGQAGGRVTTRSMPPQLRRSLAPTVATKMLSTCAHGQKADAASSFCPRSFDQAVMWQAWRGIGVAAGSPGPSDILMIPAPAPRAGGLRLSPRHVTGRPRAPTLSPRLRSARLLPRVRRPASDHHLVLDSEDREAASAWLAARPAGGSVSELEPPGPAAPALPRPRSPPGPPPGQCGRAVINGAEHPTLAASQTACHLH